MHLLSSGYVQHGHWRDIFLRVCQYYDHHDHPRAHDHDRAHYHPGAHDHDRAHYHPGAHDHHYNHLRAHFRSVLQRLVDMD